MKNEELIDVELRLPQKQANDLRKLASEINISPKNLAEWLLEAHMSSRSVQDDPAVYRVKQLVGRAEPSLPPARLKSLQTLMVRIAMFRHTADLLLLRQQAVLEEALAASRRGESLSYLTGG